MVYIQCIKYVKLNPLGGKATSKAESNPAVPSHTHHTSPTTHQGAALDFTVCSANLISFIFITVND